MPVFIGIVRHLQERTKTRRIPTVIGAVFLSLSCFHQSLSSRNTDADEAYRIYSVLLRSRANYVKSFVVADSTGVFIESPEPECLRESLEPDDNRCTNDSPAAWKDYHAKNAVSVQIKPRFDADLGIVLRRNAAPIGPSCDGPEIVQFSRVGFDTRRQFAVVSMVISYTYPSATGCHGGVTSSTVVLRREGGQWHSHGVGGAIIS